MLLIYPLNFGLKPVNPLTMGFDAMFGSAAMTFLLIGALVGTVFAFVAFAISVFSFPHLLAHEQDFISAMILSVKGVLANLPMMIIGGLIVGVMLLLATTPMFLGLVLVLPILVHATWHLYRNVVA